MPEVIITSIRSVNKEKDVELTETIFFSDVFAFANNKMGLCPFNMLNLFIKKITQEDPTGKAHYHDLKPYTFVADEEFQIGFFFNKTEYRSTAILKIQDYDIGQTYGASFVGDTFNYICEFKVENSGDDYLTTALNNFKNLQLSYNRYAWSNITYDNVMNGIEGAGASLWTDKVGLNLRVSPADNKYIATPPVRSDILRDNIDAYFLTQEYEENGMVKITYSMESYIEINRKQISDGIKDELYYIHQGYSMECSLLALCTDLIKQMPVKYIYLIHSLFETGSFATKSILPVLDSIKPESWNDIIDVIYIEPELLKSNILNVHDRVLHPIDWIYICGMATWRNSVFTNKTQIEEPSDLSEDKYYTGTNVLGQYLFLMYFMEYNNFESYAQYSYDNISQEANNPDDFLLLSTETLAKGGSCFLSVSHFVSDGRTSKKSIKSKQQGQRIFLWIEPSIVVTDNNLGIKADHSYSLMEPVTVIENFDFGDGSPKVCLKLTTQNPAYGEKYIYYIKKSDFINFAQRYVLVY